MYIEKEKIRKGNKMFIKKGSTKIKKMLAIILSVTLLLGGINIIPEVSASTSVSFDQKPPANGIYETQSSSSLNDYSVGPRFDDNWTPIEETLITLEADDINGNPVSTTLGFKSTIGLTASNLKFISGMPGLISVSDLDYGYKFGQVSTTYQWDITTTDVLGEAVWASRNSDIALGYYHIYRIKVVDTHQFDFVSNGATVKTEYKTQHHKVYPVSPSAYVPTNYDTNTQEFLGWTWPGQNTPVKDISGYTFDRDITFTAVYEDKYSVTVEANPAAGGTPTADKTNAKEGEIVTVQLDPNHEYLVEDVTTSVPVTNPSLNLATNIYTFTMPDENVKVTVNYKDKPFVPVNEDDILALEALAYKGVYDGASHDALTSAPDLGVGITYQYSANGGAYSDEIPQVEDAGQTTVRIKLSQANHQDSFVDVIAEVDQRPVNLLIDDIAITYGEADLPLTASVEAGVANEGMVDADGDGNIDTLSYTLNRTAGTDAGTYDIAATIDAAAYPNYDISAPNGTFTIEQAVLTISVDDQTITAGDAIPALGWNVTGFVAGDDMVSTGLNVTVSTPASGTLAGTFGILAIADPLTNYTFAYNNGELTVNPLPVVTPVVIPAAPAAAAPVVAIPDVATPLADEPTTIEENETPLASGASWSLLDLILTAITGLLAVSLLVTYFTGRKEMIRILSVVPMVGAIALFVFTQDMTQSMVLADEWTIVFAAMALVQGGIMFFSRKGLEEDDDQAMV